MKFVQMFQFTRVSLGGGGGRGRVSDVKLLHEDRDLQSALIPGQKSFFFYNDIFYSLLTT